MRGPRITTAVLVASLTACALAASLGVGRAQGDPARSYPYQLIDLGTLGGPQAGIANDVPTPFSSERNAFFGTADTGLTDPYGAGESGFFNSDPFVQHAFVWHDGTITDLGALGPASQDNSSFVASVNGRGDAVGASDNGRIDPLLGSEEIDAVLWKNGRIVNLGTLGGNQSVAFWLNDRDQVVGAAANSVPDAVSMFGLGTETRAFLWQHGTMRDLGTLGGADAAASFINDAGQIAGNAYTDSVVNPVTGSPTTHPFLWQDGHMHDLGTLGGTVATVTFDALNARGDVVGQSNLRGDMTFHPFLWTGGAMTDLGTFGGDLGSANTINDRGQVVGWADTTETLAPPLGEPGEQLYQAFLWTNGVLTDLGTAPGDKCSVAYGINDRGQVVGNAGRCHGAVDAFLYERGSTMNLNSLVAPSPLHLREAYVIDNHGDIGGIAVTANGDVHAYVLVPRRDAFADHDGKGATR
jgi:probable HAF family extracellular repeat protein